MLAIETEGFGGLGLAGAALYAALVPTTARLIERRREALLEEIAGAEA